MTKVNNPNDLILKQAERWTHDEWYEYFGDRPGGFDFEVPCQHQNCKMGRTVSCHTPISLRLARRGVSKERYYCHHHRLLAWNNHRHISSYLLLRLRIIGDNPGANKAKARCEPNDLSFLIEIGLVSIKEVPRGTKAVYEISLTEEGAQYSKEHEFDLAEYLVNQPPLYEDIIFVGNMAKWKEEKFKGEVLDTRIKKLILDREIF